MSTWSEERRLNQAAEAEQRRKDDDARAERRHKEREAEDKRRRTERHKDRDERRTERLQRRRDRAQRRQARAAKREKTLTPINVYRRGTLLLVALSALAAIPAQVAFFVKKSWMLLPVPFALEGAAWVMAAGVAYADEKQLPAWVRWLLRAFCVSAAGFAARINYLHGSAEEGALVGWGLAAVTMLGPLYFEVRQWVRTLAAVTANPKQQALDKAKAKHEKQRRRKHKKVAEVADKLIADAPFGALSKDKAWERARLIVYGTAEPGMTPELVAMAARSAAALAAAQMPVKVDEKTLRRRIASRFRPVEFVLPTAPGTPFSVVGTSQVVTDLPPASEKTEKTRRVAKRQPPPHRRTKGDALPFHPLAKTQAAHDARKVAVVNGHHH